MKSLQIDFLEKIAELHVVERDALKKWLAPKLNEPVVSDDNQSGAIADKWLTDFTRAGYLKRVKPRHYALSRHGARVLVEFGRDADPKRIDPIMIDHEAGVSALILALEGTGLPFRYKRTLRKVGQGGAHPDLVFGLKYEAVLYGALEYDRGFKEHKRVVPQILRFVEQQWVDKGYTVFFVTEGKRRYKEVRKSVAREVDRRGIREEVLRKCLFSSLPEIHEHGFGEAVWWDLRTAEPRPAIPSKCPSKTSSKA